MVAVARVAGSHRLIGDGSLVEFTNRWLGHLEARRFAPGTIRGYAFDLLCLARFFNDVGVDWREAMPTDFFDWLEWQSEPVSSKGKRVVPMSARRGAAPATMNRRIAAARGLFEHAVVCDVLDRNPVPAPRSPLRVPKASKSEIIRCSKHYLAWEVLAVFRSGRLRSRKVTSIEGTFATSRMSRLFSCLSARMRLGLTSSSFRPSYRPCPWHRTAGSSGW